MKTISLSKGQVSLVDDEDYEKVKNFSWFIDFEGYAQTNLPQTTKKRRKIYLHRFIMGESPGFFIDHINRNKLDNRKENLRFCTQAQNSINYGLKTNNTSGYKGVSKKRGETKWQAKIKFNYKTIYIGRYVDIKEAARKYDEKAKELFGEFAYLNFE